MNKRPELTAKTKGAIMEAFWRLYKAKGLDSITVKEVAAKAGYNRSTFYQYFPDVPSILRHLELSLIPIPSSPEELPPRGALGGEGDDRTLQEFMELYEKNREYFQVLLGDRGDPAFRGRIKRHVRPLVLGILRAPQGAGEFERELAAEYLISAMIGALDFWFSREETPPAERFLAFMNDIVERGFGRWIRA
ncbi:MAG: TetR family transcriptional regulator [Spirochaetes bacterium]|nr:MAG: TetR family transcriptional regulator [Spirochaetota bacterium]